MPEQKILPTISNTSERNYQKMALTDLENIDNTLIKAQKSEIKTPDIAQISKNSIKNLIRDGLLDIINKTNDDISLTAEEMKKDLQKLSLESRIAVSGLSTYLSNNKYSITHQTNAIVNKVINDARNTTIKKIQDLLKQAQLTMKLNHKTIDLLNTLKSRLKKFKGIADIDENITRGMKTLSDIFDKIEKGDQGTLYNVFRSFFGKLASFFTYFDLQNESAYNTDNVFSNFISKNKTEANSAMSILSNTETINMALEDMIMNALKVNEDITEDNAVEVFHSKISEIIDKTIKTPENEIYLKMLEEMQNSGKKVDKKVTKYDKLIKTLMLAANPIKENVSKMDKLLFIFHTKSEQLLSKNNDKILISQYQDAILQLSSNYKSTMIKMQNDYSEKIANGQDGKAQFKVYQQCQEAMFTIYNLYKNKIMELENKKSAVLKNIKDSVKILIEELKSCPIDKNDESKVTSQLKASLGIINKITDAGFNVEYNFKQKETEKDNVVLSIELIELLGNATKPNIEEYESFLPKEPSYSVEVGFKKPSYPNNYIHHEKVIKYIKDKCHGFTPSSNSNSDITGTAFIDHKEISNLEKYVKDKFGKELCNYITIISPEEKNLYDKKANENTKKQRLTETLLRNQGNGLNVHLDGRGLI